MAISISISFFLLVVCSILGPSPVLSSIHEYSEGLFQDNGNAFLFYGGGEGMEASTSLSSLSNGRSYLRFDSITFTRTEAAASKYTNYEPKTGLVQAVIFEAADRENIGGSAYSGRVAICCTADLAKLEGCNQGEVIRRPSAVDPKWPYIIPVSFKGNDLEATMHSETVNITKTGMYSLYFIYCDPALKGLTIDGSTVWKNPTGYLPGRMKPLMTFYGVMSLAHLLLGVVWFSQCLRFWKDILPLQNCITAVIGLGMIEVTLWYFEYANFNSTGRRPIGITVWAVTFGVVKKTIARLLILVVSMGYGVVRPTLGGLTSKVVLLGATYLVASELLDVFEHVGTINDLSGKARLLLVLPVALLDAFFILWIFTSLSKTLEKLQARRSTAKMEIYRKFTNSLAIAVIASLAWIGYEVYFKATDPFSQRWQSAWIIPGFWSILSFSLLCVICALWAPSQNSTRYAYSDDAGEEWDSEAAPMLKSTTVEFEKGEMKQKETDLTSGDVFEQDKRE